MNPSRQSAHTIIAFSDRMAIPAFKISKRIKSSRFALFVLAAGLSLLALVTYPGRARIAANRTNHQMQPGTLEHVSPLSRLLNADGTLNLKAGETGSFDPRGYRMETMANGTPRFIQASNGCNRWDSKFGLGNGTNGNVYAIAMDGDNIYVGGSFTIAGSTTAYNVAKFNQITKSWGPLSSTNGNGINGIVGALAVIGSNVYIGGLFTQVNFGNFPVPANNIASFNTTTNTWGVLGSNGGNGVGGGPNPGVSAIAANGNSLYIGGFFSEANTGGPTISTNNITRFDLSTNTWSALGSNPNSGVVSSVGVIAISGNTLYAGGYMIAKFDLVTNTWEQLGNIQDNVVRTVTDLALVGDDLYIVGSFEKVSNSNGGAIAKNIARFNTLTNTWSALGPDRSGLGGVGNTLATSLAVIGGDLYVGGTFTQVFSGNLPPLTVNRLAKFSTLTNTWSPLTPNSSDGFTGLNDQPAVFATNNNDLFIGGQFTQINTNDSPNAANNVTKFHTASLTYESLASENGNGISGYTPQIYAFAVDGNDIYVGGVFTGVGNIAANNVAKYNTITNTWSALASNSGNGVGAFSYVQVYSIAVRGNDVYVGGRFTDANVGKSPIKANNLAKYNTITRTWSGVGSAGGNGTNADVYVIEIIDDVIYVGGAFIQVNIGGSITNVSGVAQFNITTNQWNALGTGGGMGVNGIVGAISSMGDDVFFGGSFTQANIGGTPVNANRVAKWNKNNGWSALTGANNGNGVNDAVTVIVTDGNDVYVGGSFTQANVGGGPITANHIAKWNRSLGWGVLTGMGGGNGVNGDVYSLIKSGDTIYAGGQFSQANGGGVNVTANRVVKWRQNDGWTALIDSDGNNGVRLNYIMPLDPYVFALGSIGQDLYLGGLFNYSGNNVSSGITRFFCQSSSPQFTVTIADPLPCSGPGNAVELTAMVTNVNQTSQTAKFDSLLPQTVVVLPDSCTANIGACTTESGSKVHWDGTLNTGQKVTIKYRVQIADDVANGTQVCVTSTATVGNSTPGTVVSCTTINCPQSGPGIIANTKSPASDQKPGSVLFYNTYTSSADLNRQNTRINLTNTHPALPAYAHLFFIDGSNCSVADSFLCLTANQTISFLAGDLDPGTTGYIVAVATDTKGCPTSFNYLIGDEYVKFASGHAANLSAQAVTAIAGGLPFCDDNSTTAPLAFDGISYSVLPQVLSLDNIGSRADGNDTMLILNRLGGNLGTGAATLGSIFGLLFDDGEAGLSFSFTSGACQFRSSFSNNFPRTTPRFETHIPAGHTGWVKLWISSGPAAMSGAAINFNANASTESNAFNQGHNLHTLTNTASTVYTLPVFPPSC